MSDLRIARRKEGRHRPDRNAADTAFQAGLTARHAPLSAGHDPPAGSSRLRLIATTDLHGQLLSYDYFANRPLSGSGLARIACLIEAARAEVPNAILLDNGDFFQGSALVDPGVTGLARRPHPAIRAFNTLGYDAVALGNHEFDFGIDSLSKAIADARFPVLSANVLLEKGETPLQDRGFCPPFALIRREIALPCGRTRPVTIGILALTPPEIQCWNHRQIAGRLQLRPMEEAARAWLPEIRRQGADLIVVLAHTGLSDPGRAPHPEEQAALIAALPGVDAVIAGHTHLVFPASGSRGMVAGKPLVQPGQQGSHLGVIDLWLSETPSGWEIVSACAGTIGASEAVAGMPASAIRQAATPLRRALAQDHRAALGMMRKPLGSTRIPLSSWFAHIADSQALRLIAAAKIAYVKEATGWREGIDPPVIALVNAFRSGGRGGPQNYTHIPAGPLTWRHIFDLYPYPNTITAEEMTGAGLAARLENSAALYNRISPRQQDQQLIDPDVPGFLCQVAIGTSYRIDLSRPARPRLSEPEPGRVRDLRVGSKPLLPQDRLIVVTNSYLAGSSGAGKGRMIFDDGTLCTELLAGYIRRQGPLGRHEGGGWSFLPMPGTSLQFETGSGALPDLSDIAAFRPEPLGLTEEGFYRFRLHL